MTFPLAGLGASSATTDPSRRNELGRDQFLSLLVAQLRHQDPLSPLEPDAFAAQLAQFSSVEQLSKLNEAFDAQRAQQAKQGLLDQTALGASLIGKRVLAEGNQIEIASGGSVTLPVSVAGVGGSATVRFIDGAGRVVATNVVGAVGGGQQTLKVDPGLPAGSYRYDVEVLDAGGRPVGVTPYIDGVVDAILFDNGSVTLRMGSLRVPLENLTEIQS